MNNTGNWTNYTTATPGNLSSLSIHYILGGELIWTTGVSAGLLGFLGFGENLVVFLFLFFKHGCLDAPSNICLLSLAIAEGSLCIVGVPLFICTMFLDLNFEYFIITGRFLAFLTVYNVFLLAMNRLISVAYSLQYSTVFSKRRAVILVILGWILGFFLMGLNGIGYFMGIRQLTQLLKYFLVIFLVLVVMINCYLYKISRKHKKRISALFQSVQPDQVNFVKKDFRAIKSLALVTGSFVLGWLPMSVTLIATNRFTNANFFYTGLCISVPFVTANAALDPVIYFFRTEDFKKMYFRRKMEIMNYLGFSSLPPRKTAASVIF